MTSRYAPHTLGWWMDERRGELQLSWREVAARAGVSVATLMRNTDDPSGMRTTTKKGIERALRWKSGSIDAILDDGEPTEEGAERSEDEVDQAELAALKQMAAEVQAQAESQIALAHELMNRIDRLGRSSERRAAQ